MTMTPRRISIVILAILTILLVYAGLTIQPAQPLPETPVTTVEQIIHIDFTDTTTSHLRHGLLNGPNHYTKKDSTTDTASSFLDPLKLRTWRFSGVRQFGYGGDIYKFVVDDYRYKDRFGTSIVVNLQDIFMAEYGYPAKVRPVCFGANNCFTSFNTLQEAWKKTLEEFLLQTDDIQIDYFDLLAEVDLGGFQNVSWEETYTLMKDAYNLVKQYRPDVKIIAPSNAGFSPKIYEELLRRIQEDNVKLDAVSWHELGDDPSVLPSHVSAMKSLFQKHPDVCDPKCPEIHINEYQGENFMLVPGHIVGWLENLEKSEVDHANKACWGGDPGTPIPYESCWYGFSGLLMPDSLSPQPIYYVYKYYAELKDKRYRVVNTPQKISVIAGEKWDGENGIILGNYGTTSHDAIVMLTGIKTREVEFSVYKIPNTNNQVTSLPKLTREQTFKTENEGGFMKIPVGTISPGEAYWIEISDL